jgi:hypothetical protein
MPTGSLAMQLTDTRGEPIPGDVRIDFKPASQSSGGAAARVDFSLSGETELEISSLSCSGGLGTRYEVRLTTEHFKTYAFFQLIQENAITRATDDPIRLVVKPKHVSDITAGGFSSLPVALRSFLQGAQMQTGEKKYEDEDEELLNKAGQALYDALGPLRKACLLNLFAKGRHVSAAKAWNLLKFPVILRQDRCFCEVDASTADVLTAEPRFVSAPSELHKPLAGYTILSSFKSRDAHANLQVTVMQHDETGALAADVDIDEASGIAHGFEVIRNSVSGRTNPYLVRELLLLADEEPGSLDPGYRFVLDE